MSDFGSIQTVLHVDGKCYIGIGEKPSESIRYAFEAAEIRTGQRVSEFKSVVMVTEPVSK